MAKCKLCRKNIPDGTQYCKDCQDKGKANESYLDSLLNSVKNTTPAAETVYKKKNDKNIVQSDVTNDNAEEADEFLDDDFFDYDIGDIEEFNHYDMESDLSDFQDDTIISNEELFGEDISNIFPEDSSNINTDQIPSQASVLTEQDEKVEDQDIEEIHAQSVVVPEVIQDNLEANDSSEYESMNEITDYTEDDYDSDLNEILNQIDGMQNDHADDAINHSEPIMGDEIDFTKPVEEPQEMLQPDDQDMYDKEEEDDILSLLNQISDDDPVADDVRAISDLMGQEAYDTDMPSDVGEVFSDALKVVSNLNDLNLDEAELLNNIPDKKAGRKKEKKKKSKKVNNELNSEGEDIPKVSLLKRLFGNVVDKKASQKEADSNASNTKADHKAGKAAKKGKASKGKKDKAAEVDELDEDLQDQGAANNKKDKKKAKKDKKEKKDKKNTSDVIQVIDEIEEDLGRINRLGAAIVFVFFGLLAALIYVGSNAVSYTLNIQHAATYFDTKEYTEAYNEVYGMEIHDEDMELYSKIVTVMFVNKQLNSYNNYNALGQYPQALDSLLKGLKRYDKYIKLATILGIKTDMDYVRGQILAELKNKFDLSEEDAFNIIDIDDRNEYSLKVYGVTSENNDLVKTESKGM